MKEYWTIGKNEISWEVEKGQIHTDDVEMSGFATSFLVCYGISEDGKLFIQRHCVWPTLRLLPNNTHASFQTDIPSEILPSIYVNDKKQTERPVRFCFDGALHITSITESGLSVIRQLFPSVTEKNCYEQMTLRNNGLKPISFIIKGEDSAILENVSGAKGVYVVEYHKKCKKALETAKVTLFPKQELIFSLTYTAHIANEPVKIEDSELALRHRYRRIECLTESVQLDTGDPVIDTMAYFAKIRAGESIFDTLEGLMHSPGGRSYYAAVWCNDEVEYAAPWFAFTGYKFGIEASMNTFRLYSRFMADNMESIPSSIIAEGMDVWSRDRGDEAMYCYGASAFALICGDREMAEKLLPSIEWCLAFCESRKGSEGVILSETDELEGRFPSGDANLNTSSLYYAGLIQTAYLAEALDRKEKAEAYRARAEALHTDIMQYFSGKIHGYDTFKYYKENTTLRSWIVMPLCMGIYDKAPGTVEAMLSPYLWTEDGLLSEEGTEAVWDRSTLYGFRGAFAAGFGDKIMDAFRSYCSKRLIGERVPYPVEAYPEGSKRHLSGESALFGQIIVSGLLNIIPTGLNKFTFIPRLPRTLDHVYVRNIRAFGAKFDIEIDADGYRILNAGSKKIIKSGALNVPAEVEF